MVSFFGLKLSNKKKKSESKFDTKEAQGPKHIETTGVVNGSIRSVSRAGTSQGATSPYALADTHNLAASSMFDLGNVPSAHCDTPNSLHLRPNASEMNLRTRFGENNGSMASLGMPTSSFVSRPGTSSGKNKPWVDPLDVHFMRTTPTTEQAGEGSTFGKEADSIVNGVMNSVNKQEEQKPKDQELEKEAQRQQETARLELERLERQKSTETIVASKAPPQPQPHAQIPSDSQSELHLEAQAEPGLSQSGMGSPTSPGPIFRGHLDQRPSSRSGMRGNGPSPVHQGPPPTGPPTHSLPQPPGQGKSRQSPHPPSNEGFNGRPEGPSAGPHIIGHGPGSPYSRTNGTPDPYSSRGRPGPGPHGPHSHGPQSPQFHGHGPPRGPPQGPARHGSPSHGPPRHGSPSQRSPYGPPQGPLRHGSPSQWNGAHGSPSSYSLRSPPSQGQPHGRGPHLRGPISAGTSPQTFKAYKPYRPELSHSVGPNSPASESHARQAQGNSSEELDPNDGPQQPSVDDVPDTPATEQGPPVPLISSLTSPTASTSASTARSSVNDDFMNQPAPQAVIRDVTAKRDTLSALNTPRQHSLSMKIEELEKSLLRQQAAEVEQMPLVQSPEQVDRRISGTSSCYSNEAEDRDRDNNDNDDDDDDEPILSIQPAPLRIPTPIGAPLAVSASDLQSPLEKLGAFGVPDDAEISPSSRTHTPSQVRYPNWRPEPNKSLPTPTSDTGRPSRLVDTGFKFDFGPGISTPLTPDSSNWPLPSPTTERGPFSGPGSLTIHTGQNESSDAAKFARANVPPPLNLEFNFSPDASSRDPTLGKAAADMLTPPLQSAPPTIALNDGRPSTSSGLAASPSFISKFPELMREDDAASFMGIGMARGPSIRETRRPGTSSSHYRMVDSFGTGFI
ncbi:hypothetical protein QBC42DRAFT_348461 [Cladorrhinum samala]|uniref:Uncharacterized protein n=1 Tax=Cladorrhinum samala TaxID=585594 RepID=A0AAV9HHF2_9PEZI|nr:hypothetical protein QBC42DRAFT_348461 [Cladorrhinum samala]